MFPRVWPGYKSKALTPDEAFDLWAEYSRIAEDNLNLVAEDMVLRLRYEDLLADPADWLRRIAEFVEVSLPNETLHRLAQRPDATRKFAFVTDENARIFYLQHCNHQEMRRHCYDQIIDQK